MYIFKYGLVVMFANLNPQVSDMKQPKPYLCNHITRVKKYEAGVTDSQRENYVRRCHRFKSSNKKANMHTSG